MRIFLVHHWETADNKHHLHVFDKDVCMHTIYFKEDKWEEAMRIANKMATMAGQPTYTIDEPNRPHKEVKVDVEA